MSTVHEMPILSCHWVDIPSREYGNIAPPLGGTKMVQFDPTLLHRVAVSEQKLFWIA